MLAMSAGGFPVLLLFAAACGGSSSSSTDGPIGSGTLAYSELDTYNIHLVDLATGSDSLIDGGMFGGVAIAPDGNRVAYNGVDKLVKVADRTPSIAGLPPQGCAQARWITADAIAFCGQSGTMLVAPLGTSARYLDDYNIAVSPDATHVAWVGARGDTFVENLDGSDHRILVPSPDPTAVNALEGVTTFTPDGRAVVLYDFSTSQRIHIVSLADGHSIDVDDARPPSSSGGGPATITGASMFSPDGSELLAVSSTALVAVSVATGAKRTLVTFGANISSGAAAFLDATHVLWVRIDDQSVGDHGVYFATVHVAGPNPGDDVLVDDPGVPNQTLRSIVVSPHGELALASDVLLARADGTVIARNDQSSEATFISDIFGATADGTAFVAATFSGKLVHVRADGTITFIANGADPRAASQIGIDAPFAAFAP